MERIQFGIKNSRIWHLCNLPIEIGGKITLDNWTRYASVSKEIFYINEKIKFLEVNHYLKTFILFPSGLRKSNEDQFRAYYTNYLNYIEKKR